MYSVKEPDGGTPLRVSEQRVTLEIDGAPVTVPAGTSVMRAAAEAGVKVPRLCATDTLEAFGSCRLCLVEIEGRRGYPASCTTPVEPGMKVRTQSDRLARLRRGSMELYVSDHPLDCLTCPANGNCELQEMAGAVGLREVRYGTQGKNHLALAKNGSNPYFSFDPSKCIACARCVFFTPQRSLSLLRTFTDLGGIRAQEGRGIANQTSADNREVEVDVMSDEAPAPW